MNDSQHEIFDQYARNYEAVHRENIKLSGEDPEFFHEYKVADVAAETKQHDLSPRRILDFGSGIGNSIPYWSRYFAGAELVCADKSADSIQVAKERFPSSADYVQISDASLDMAKGAVDVAFAACVFHHIPENQHHLWLAELHRVTAARGMLFVYEHNPLNPLTVRAVRSCPFDVDAKLIRAREMCRRVTQSGWKDARIRFRIFFPGVVAALRPAEKWLTQLPLGAQYYVLAKQS